MPDLWNRRCIPCLCADRIQMELLLTNEILRLDRSSHEISWKTKYYSHGFCGALRRPTTKERLLIAPPSLPLLHADSIAQRKDWLPRGSIPRPSRGVMSMTRKARQCVLYNVEDQQPKWRLKMNRAAHASTSLKEDETIAVQKR